ncbi:MAG: RNA polymerase sigma factor [Saprospiraceae bacterium]|jgi:RNA polymerase sigma factor (sigma-70 family)
METIEKVVKQWNPADLDQQLVAEALRGNQLAFSGLMDRYRTSISRMVSRMVPHATDTEDLTMEIFEKAFYNLGLYVPNFAFSTWLFRIAINHCIDYLRKKRTPYLPIDASNLSVGGNEAIIHSLTTSNPSPEELFIYRQRAEHLQKLMGRLSAKNRKVLEMLYYEGFSYEEIANQTGAPVGTIKAQLHRAREALLSLIEKNPDLSLYPDFLPRHCVEGAERHRPRGSKRRIGEPVV